MKECEMGGACSTYNERRDAQRVLVAILRQSLGIDLKGV
jgi:hypothetical protein